MIAVRIAVAGSDQGGNREMLVLTRKLDQSIMIGDDIEISVLAVSGEKVRIGIDAPREVPVFRKEVYVTLSDTERGSGEGTPSVEGTPAEAPVATPAAETAPS